LLDELRRPRHYHTDRKVETLAVSRGDQDPSGTDGI
jgi:hypothetical protein